MAVAGNLRCSYISSVPLSAERDAQTRLVVESVVGMLLADVRIIPRLAFPHDRLNHNGRFMRFLAA